MCCGWVGISWIPIDVVLGHYSSTGIRALAKKMLFKLVDKLHAMKSHSLVCPQSLSVTAGDPGVSKTSGGQTRELNRCGDCGGVVWPGGSSQRTRGWQESLGLSPSFALGSLSNPSRLLAALSLSWFLYEVGLTYSRTDTFGILLIRHNRYKNSET